MYCYFVSEETCLRMCLFLKYWVDEIICGFSIIILIVCFRVLFTKWLSCIIFLFCYFNKVYVCMTLWIMNIIVFTTLRYFKRKCLKDSKHQILKMVFGFHYLNVASWVWYWKTGKEFLQEWKKSLKATIINGPLQVL